MILLIDNYDSFTYNLYQYLGEMGADLRVIRNDEMTAEQALALGPERIVISPGPGNPDQAGMSLEIIRRAAGKVPLLGVCLGHQSLGQVFGGRVVRAPKLMHGKTSQIHHDGLRHLALDPIQVECAVLHPLGDDHHGVRPLHALIGVVAIFDVG